MFGYFKAVFKEDFEGGYNLDWNKDLKQAFDEYAQVRFDEAMVEDKRTDSCLPFQSDCDQGIGWNKCRQAIIDNWNDQSKE